MNEQYSILKYKILETFETTGEFVCNKSSPQTLEIYTEMRYKSIDSAFYKICRELSKMYKSGILCRKMRNKSWVYTKVGDG